MFRMGKLSVLVVGLVVALVAGACSTTPPAPVSPIGADCTDPPTIGPSASLYNCVLSGLDLSGVDLSGADLRGADLSGSNLSGADLSGARMNGANLTGTNLTGAQMAGAILSGAILLGAIFVGANLFGALFDFGGFKVPGGGSGGSGGGGANPPGPCSGPYCPGYNEATIDTGEEVCGETYGADDGLPSFYLHQDSDTLEAKGQRSTVTDSATDFTGATLGGSQFAFRGLSLAKANFTNATISDVMVGCQSGSGGRFDGATFLNTSLIDVTLPSTTAVGVTFSNMSMCAVNFSDSDFDGAVFLAGTRSSCVDTMETLPPGFSAIVMFERSSLVGAQFGDPSATEPPDSQQRVNWEYTMSGPGASVTFEDADLDNVVVAHGNFNTAVFDNASLAGFSSSSLDQFAAGRYYDIDFTTADWSSASFVGPHEWQGSTCPDGSTGDWDNPCF